MKGLVLSALVVALGVTVGPQVQTPVYRAGVYLLPFRITITPARTMTNDDFLFVVDQKEYAPTDTVADPSRRGRFMIYFQPPIELRDGRKRTIQIKVKLGGKWRDGLKSVTVTMPKPEGGR